MKGVNARMTSLQRSLRVSERAVTGLYWLIRKEVRHKVYTEVDPLMAASVFEYVSKEANHGRS